MIIGIILVSWTARYLEPSQFGRWNYAIAFVAIFSTLANLGLDQIVIKEIINHSEVKNEFLGTAFFLKLIGGIGALFLSLIFIYIIKKDDFIIVGIISAGFIFQSFDVIDFYFQSELKSKYVVYAKNISFILIALFKIWLILSAAALIAFVWTSLLEIILSAIFLIYFYNLNNNYLKNWKFNINYAKTMLQASWPLILSGIAIIIYMRIDQIMLGQIVGNNAVGNYSAALKISELWYIVPISVSSSIYPILLEKKKKSQEDYFKNLQLFYDVMFTMAFFISIFIMLFGNKIIFLLYGANYSDASTILIIHIWSSIFVFLGVAAGYHLLIEELTKISFYRALIGAIINIILNLILIPQYSGIGAAIATLISYSFESFWSNLFFKKTKIIFFMMLKSLNIFRLARILIEKFSKKYKI